MTLRQRTRRSTRRMRCYTVHVVTFDDGCHLVYHRHPDGHVVIEQEERKHFGWPPRWRKTDRAALRE